MTRRLRLFGLVVALLCGMAGITQAQTITTGTVTPATVCPGGTVSVPFSTSGLSGTRQYVVQLASTTAGPYTTISTPTSLSTATGNLTATVPTATAAGSYVVRVTGTLSATVTNGSTSTLTVSAIPAAPAVATTSYTVCQGATSPTISATLGTAGSTYAWTPGAGSPALTGQAKTGTSLTANVPTGTAGTFTYTVTETNAAGCTSPASAVISVTVRPTPAAPAVSPVSLCLNATASPLTPTASGGATLVWYASPSSTTALAGAPTPPTSATGTTNYAVSQTLNGCEGPKATVAVTVRPLPGAPSSTTATLSYCQNTTGISPLTATASSGGTLNWYSTSPTSATLSAAPTPPTSATGTLGYAVSQTVNGCEGPTTAITVTIRPQPALPSTTTSLTYCVGTASAPPLSATAVSGATLNWYATATTSTTLTAAPTPPTSASGTTNYFVSQTAANGCESERAQITVRVKPLPVAPSVRNLAICEATRTPAPLTATAGAGNSLNWYSAPTSGTALVSAPTPATDRPGATSYYVSQTQEGCEGPRAELVVTINPLPAVPGVQDFRICQLAASPGLTANGQNLKWYNQFGDPFPNTPEVMTNLVGTFTYQVTQTSNQGCESQRAALNVVVMPLPTPPAVTSPVVYCQNQTAQPLQATGTNLKWTDPYGNITTTAPVPPTQNVTAGASYSVTQTGTNGCESLKSEIRLIINAPPTASLSGSTSVNLGQPASLTITFTSVPPFSYTLSNGTSGQADNVQQVLTVTPSQTTIYQVTGVSNVCGNGLPLSTATVTVRIPTITTGALSATTVCAGTAISVPFTTTGEFNAGNVFRVQLADTTTKNYTDLTQASGQGPIQVTIPSGTAQGLYFVRVIGTNPSIPVLGRNSPTVLNVRALPTATLSGSQDTYEGQSAQLSVAFTGDAPWTFTYADSLQSYNVTTSANPHPLRVTPARTSTYRLTTVSNNCGTGRVSGTATVRVLPVLGLEPDPLAKSVRVYPVPTETSLTVDIDLPLAQQPAKLILRDFNGRPVLQTQTRQRQTTLDLRQQAAGTYLLHIQVGSRTTVRKIMKR